MKKRKQNNMNKRFSQVARGAIKDLAICFVETNPKAQVVSLKHKAKVRPSEAMIRAFTSVPYKWTIYLSVIGKDWAGNLYTKSLEVETGVPCLQDTLAEQLWPIHNELRDGMPERDYICRAWIASPHGYSFDEAEAMEYFDMIGVAERDAA